MTSQNDVDAFLATYPAEVVSSLTRPGACLDEMLPEAEETLDRSARVIGFGYGPGYKGCVCTLIMSQKGRQDRHLPAAPSCPTRRGCWVAAARFIVMSCCRPLRI